MDKNKDREANIKFFNDNLEKWIKDPLFKHKFVVIHNQKLSNCFDTFEKALEFSISSFGEEDFIIQEVIGQDEEINFLSAAI